MARFVVLSTGHVVEIDDAAREPKLIGKLSWPTCPIVTTRDVMPDQGGSPPSWPEGTWGELVADCACGDCQLQRGTTKN